MSIEPDGSITRWLGALKEGDPTAAKALWDRNFRRLVRLARTKLRAAHHPGAVEDEEDAALSAFDSFCAGATRGQFAQVDDRDDLWRLLVVITARKTVDQLERRGRQKRGGGRLVTEADLRGSGGRGEDEPNGLEHVPDPSPSPEFEAIVTEECERRLDQLWDDERRLVAVRRMEGYSIDEIALELGLGRRTVVRRLQSIRACWMDKDPGPSPHEGPERP